MGDPVISITARILEEGPGAGVGRILNAEELVGLATGCSRVLAALGPRLALRVEVIKIVPRGRASSSHVNYDVRTILGIPVEGGEVQKLECMAKVDLYRYPEDLDLADEFSSKVLKSVHEKFVEYDKYLERKRIAIKGFSPAKQAS